MINYAVIGIGRMGGRHAKNLALGRARGAVLKAVCDLDTQKTEKFIKRFPSVKGYSCYKDMLSKEKLDAVIIATPHYAHVPIAVDALKSGVSVLTEKPAAVTVSEAQRLIEESRRHDNLLCGVMYNQRTNRMYKKAKEIIDSGALGEIKRIDLIVTDWYRSQYYYGMGGWRASWNGEGGGLLINQCVHQLDILQWLVGMPEALTAWAAAKNRQITVENDVTAVMEYGSGVRCCFSASGHELKGTNRLEIAADKGKIVIDKYKMRYYKFKKSEREVNETTKRGYGFTTAKVKRFNYGFFNALHDLIIGQQLNIIKNFTAALEGKDALIAPCSEGVKALSIINGIYLSAYAGKKVSFPLDGGEIDGLYEEFKKTELNGQAPFDRLF